MLFNSYEFIYLFFPIVFFTYWAFVKSGCLFSKLALCCASIGFYSFMAMEYMPLMILSIIINYIIGNYIYSSKGKLLFFLGLAFNLSFIFFYKYFDLIFHYTFNVTNELMNTIIPLGISFYTFTQIAYLIDSYHGKLSTDRSFTSYFLFVTYFPHLVAGPILHHREMITLFSNKTSYVINYQNIFQGLCFFVLGLSKKVLIADSLISYVNPVFKIVIICPIHESLFNFQKTLGGEKAYASWLKDLRESFNIVIDFNRDKKIVSSTKNFFDAAHFYPVVGDYLVHKMIEENGI